MRALYIYIYINIWNAFWYYNFQNFSLIFSIKNHFDYLFFKNMVLRTEGLFANFHSGLCPSLQFAHNDYLDLTTRIASQYGGTSK